LPDCNVVSSINVLDHDSDSWLHDGCEASSDNDCVGILGKPLSFAHPSIQLSVLDCG
jgi:hypothetical protein